MQRTKNNPRTHSPQIKQSRNNDSCLFQSLYPRKVAVTKILVTEFITVKVSQHLNLMKNMSAQ